MKTISTLLIFLSLGVGVAEARGTLTTRQARVASRKNAEQTLGTLLYRSIGSAPVSVANCKVHARRGVCRVRVNGTNDCSYVSHVLSLPQGMMVWGTNLKCK